MTKFEITTFKKGCDTAQDDKVRHYFGSKVKLDYNDHGYNEEINYNSVYRMSNLVLKSLRLKQITAITNKTGRSQECSLLPSLTVIATKI